MRANSKVFLFFHTLLTVWLVAYFHKRYNGGDFTVYLDAADAVQKGVSPYRFDVYMPFRYAPFCAYFFYPLAYLPREVCHWAQFIFSVFALWRFSYLLVRLYEKYWPISSKWEATVIAMLPWLLVIQGIGAQIEGGNLNILLIVGWLEGFWQYSQGRSVLGLALIALAGIFKPQFYSLFFFLALLDFNEKPKAFLGGLGAFALLLFLPMAFLGWQGGVREYQTWILLNHAQAYELYSMKKAAVTLSLYSFFVHKLHWSDTQVSACLLMPLLFLLSAVLLLSRSALFALMASIWLVFHWSPLSYPYTIAVLAPVGVLGLGAVLHARTKEWRMFFGLVYALLLLSLWGTSYDVVGKLYYTSVVVPYRVQAWLSLPSIFLFFTPETLRAGRAVFTKSGMVKKTLPQRTLTS